MNLSHIDSMNYLIRFQSTWTPCFIP